MAGVPGVSQRFLQAYQAGPVRRVTWGCHICEHPVSGTSERALKAAMDDHAEYVNATADRVVDAHFEAARLDELVIR